MSDPESKAIKAFDILNPNGEKGTRYEGIPFPGIYVINEKGTITAKYFDDDYRERFSAASILTREFGSDGVMKNTVENTQLKLTYSASEATVTPPAVLISGSAIGIYGSAGRMGRAIATIASTCCSRPCSSCQNDSAASVRFSSGIFFQRSDGRTGGMFRSYTG